MLEFHVCSTSTLHSKEFLITVVQLYELAQVVNAKNNRHRTIEFTYSQVTTSECIQDKNYHIKGHSTAFQL